MSNEGEPKPAAGVGAEGTPPDGEKKDVVLVGTGDGENQDAENKKQKESEKKDRSEDESKQQSKGATAENNPKKKENSDALKKAVEKDPILSDVLSHQAIQTDAVENFIITKTQQGLSASEVGKALKNEVIHGQLSDEAEVDARNLLDKLAKKMQDPDLEIPEFALFKKSILPPIDEPLPPDPKDPDYQKKVRVYEDKLEEKIRHKNLEMDVLRFSDDLVENPPLDEQGELKKLERIGDEILRGKRPQRDKNGAIGEPLYNSDEADGVMKRIRDRRFRLQSNATRRKEEQYRVQEEKQAEGTSIYLGEKEKRNVAILGFEEFKRHLIGIYEPLAYPSTGEEGSKKRIDMLLEHMQVQGSRFDTDFTVVRALRGMSINDAEVLYEALGSYTMSGDIISVSVGESEYKREYAIKKIEIGTPKYDALNKEKHELKEMVDAYVSLRFTGAALEYGVKPESAVNSVSDKSWNAVLASENGVIELVYNLYDSKLNTAMSSNTNITHKITNIDMERMQESIIREIRENPYYAKLVGREISEVEAAYFMHVARNLSKVMFKPTVAAVKSRAALGELENGVVSIVRRSHDGNTEELADNGTDESYSAAFDLIAFIEKWEPLPPGAKIMLYRTGEFAAKRLGLSGEVKNEALNLLNRARGNGPESEAAQVIISKKLRKVWGDPLDKIQGANGEIDRFDGRYQTWESVERNKMDIQKQLEFVLMAEKGFPVISELLEAYDYDSSGWRIKERLKQLSRIYLNADNMALGYQIQLAGSKWLGDSSKTKDAGEINAAFQGLKAELDKTAKYRPQTNALWLYQQKDGDFTTWWTGDGVQSQVKTLLAGLKGQEWLSEDKLKWISFEGKIGFAMAHDAVMDKFICVNAELERQALGPVDFSDQASMSDAQRKAVLSVFGNDQNAVDTYCSFMKTLSDQVSGQTDVFKKAEYRRYFKRTQFTDDARLRQMEDPKLLLEHAKKDNKGNIEKDDDGNIVGWEDSVASLLHKPDQIVELMQISKVIGAGGENRRGALARFIGDFAAMKEMPKVIVDGLTSDIKKFQDMIEKIKQGESMYAGEKAAITASVYLAAGYLKMAETDSSVLKMLNIGESFGRTSEQKRFFGDKGQSLGDKGMDDFLDMIDFVHSKIEGHGEAVEELVFDLEEELGLAERDRTGKKIWREDMRSPYFKKRIALVVLALIAIFSIETGKKVLQSAEEGLGEGGGKRK